MIIKKTNQIPWCPKLRGATDNIWYPAYVQRKIDGEYALIHYNDGDIYTCNKRGLVRSHFPALYGIQSKLDKAGIKEITLIAELYFGDGKNHSLYKLLANKRSDLINIYVHDVMETEKTTSERIVMLQNMDLCPEYKLVEDDAQTQEVFEKTIAEGYEGIVIKPCVAKLYMSSKWVKMKSEDETEMAVTNLCPGQERIELSFMKDNVIVSVGAKCDNNMKRTLKVGDCVIVKHFGFLKSGVRNPIVIKKGEK